MSVETKLAKWKRRRDRAAEDLAKAGAKVAQLEAKQHGKSAAPKGLRIKKTQSIGEPTVVRGTSSL